MTVAISFETRRQTAVKFSVANENKDDAKQMQFRWNGSLNPIYVC